MVNSESQLNALRSNPEVALVEQDQVVKANALKTVLDPSHQSHLIPNMEMEIVLIFSLQAISLLRLGLDRLMPSTRFLEPRWLLAAIYCSYNPSRKASDVRNFLVDQVSTMNVIPGLDAASPNRLLYSRIDNLNQTDRTLPPTVAPTRSPTMIKPTLPPTVSFHIFWKCI